MRPSRLPQVEGFRSTPPREGRPVASSCARAPKAVSIHAPTRGATARWRSSRCSGPFRSTPPREGRPSITPCDPIRPIVSIHAPTRGATLRNRIASARRSLFRSTPPREGRLVYGAKYQAWQAFRSTPPREGRLPLQRRRKTLIQFRSTPPREGRPNKPRHSDMRWQFRSTPPREGRRCLLEFGIPCLEVSIHAPTRGATLRAHSMPSSRLGFDPRPHARGDAAVIFCLGGAAVSIHAPTRGATPLL